MAIAHSAFRLSLGMLPRGFRETHAAEMDEVFQARLCARTPIAVVPFAIAEVAGVAGVAIRLFLEAHPHQQRTVGATLAVALLATTLSIGGLLRSQQGSGQMKISGSDPAGPFTLTLSDGQIVGATMNGIALPATRLTHTADSIRVLNTDGTVSLALAFDVSKGSIAWAARPAR